MAAQAKLVRSRTEQQCSICGDTIPVRAPHVRFKGGRAHPECSQRRESLLATPVAAAQLGISSAQFLKLAERVGLRAESWYTNPHYRSGPMCPLWSPEDVTALAAEPELQLLIDRSRASRRARMLKAEQRESQFRQQYPDWRQALEHAAEAMFSLNRYAKWSSCSAGHCAEIYFLKNGCGGEGCERCAYTGLYREPGALVYVAFRFQINERVFSWHQPARAVKWLSAEAFNAATSTWEPEGEKPLEMRSRTFADAKALVRFVLESAGVSE